MKKRTAGWKSFLLTLLALVWIFAIPVLAEEGGSGDNSLSTLGITTEGVTVSPDFVYSTIEYNVTVPAGTKRLELSPVTSNENAWIVDITGQDIGEDGTTTVVITVSAENGSQYSYYLYVTTDTSAQAVEPATEVQTEAATEKQTETEPETEDPRYIKVDRSSLEEAENTIATLKSEASSYRDRQSLLMKILYGLIGVCVVLLFVVINLLLKKRDLKAERDSYLSMGYPQNSKKDAPDGCIGSFAENGSYIDPSEQSYSDAPYEGQVQENFRENTQNGDSSYGEDPYQADFQETAAPDGDMASEEKPVKDSGKKTGRKEKKSAHKKKDDPADVPKPSQAKKQSRPMPEYQEPEPEHEYNPPKEKSEHVEINMIDL